MSCSAVSCCAVLSCVPLCSFVLSCDSCGVVLHYLVLCWAVSCRAVPSYVMLRCTLCCDVCGAVVVSCRVVSCGVVLPCHHLAPHLVGVLCSLGGLIRWWLGNLLHEPLVCGRRASPASGGSGISGRRSCMPTRHVLSIAWVSRFAFRCRGLDLRLDVTPFCSMCVCGCCPCLW